MRRAPVQKLKVTGEIPMKVPLLKQGQLRSSELLVWIQSEAALNSNQESWASFFKVDLKNYPRGLFELETEVPRGKWIRFESSAAGKDLALFVHKSAQDMEGTRVPMHGPCGCFRTDSEITSVSWDLSAPQGVGQSQAQSGETCQQASTDSLLLSAKTAVRNPIPLNFCLPYKGFSSKALIIEFGGYYRGLKEKSWRDYIIKDLSRVTEGWIQMAYKTRQPTWFTWRIAGNVKDLVLTPYGSKLLSSELESLKVDKTDGCYQHAHGISYLFFIHGGFGDHRDRICPFTEEKKAGRLYRMSD